MSDLPPARRAPSLTPVQWLACVLAAIGFAFTLATQEFVPGDPGFARLAWAAAIVGFTVYAVALACSALLPEPEAEGLPD